jgi:membrane protein implicated in regulation of membrane protease activity
MLLNWILIIAGAVCVLTEVAMGGFAGFDLVLIGSAVALGGLTGLIVGNPIVGLVVAAILSLLYIAVGRRWVRARLQHKTVASNADALVGQTALVTQRIAEHHPGQVKVKDEVWRAAPMRGVAGPFETGAVVVVEDVDGVTLLVRSRA